MSRSIATQQSRTPNPSYVKFPNITRVEYQGSAQQPSRKQNSIPTPTNKLTTVSSSLSNTENMLRITRINSNKEEETGNSLPRELRFTAQTNQGLLNIRSLKMCDPVVEQGSSLERDGSMKENNKKKFSTKHMVEVRISAPKRASSRPPKPLQVDADQIYKIIHKMVLAGFGLMLHPQQATESYSFRAMVDKGNNSVLVKQTIKLRQWWNVVNAAEDDAAANNLVWTQFRQKVYTADAQERIPANEQALALNKIVLTKSVFAQLQSCRGALKLFFTKPIEQVTASDILKLIKSYNQKQKYLHDARKMQLTNHIPENHHITNKKTLFKNLHRYYVEVAKTNPFETIPVTYHVSGVEDQEFAKFREYADGLPKKTNMWVIKPGENTNRGNGISVHKGTDNVAQHIASLKTKHTHIIQLYIRPYLYCQRKFDIRCYMLVILANRHMKGYWFEEGYIRTASEPFSFKKMDKMIHLTNDAIQKHGQNYGKYEPGNKLSYQELDKYITQKNGDAAFQAMVLPKMKSICRDILLASQGRLGANRSEDAFEIYGLDYMIDEDLKPWLIEVNTNPCLQLSSSLLSRIIPQMLQNGFRIALDPFAPTVKKVGWKASMAKSNRFQLIYQS